MPSLHSRVTNFLQIPNALIRRGRVNFSFNQQEEQKRNDNTAD
jgi:hypothetical protein